MDDIALWLALGATLVSLWLTNRRVNRIRETLRRNRIVYDLTKPWEGA